MRQLLFILAACLCISWPGGVKSEPIRALQQILSDRNCQPGGVDGVWGSRTATALSNLNAEIATPVTRPITDEDIEGLKASSVRCLTWAEMTDRVYDGNILSANVARNAQKYCQLGSWNHFLGRESDVKIDRNLRIDGDDLAKYLASADPFMNLLLRLNVTALRTGQIDELRNWFMEAVENDAFTHLEPYRPVMWHGERVHWIEWYRRNMAMAEPAYYAALLMSAMAQSYGILRDHLSEEQRTSARRWGERVHRASDIPEVRSERWADRRAAAAAGYTSWGAAAGDKRIYERGTKLFKEGVHDIRSDGSESAFVGSRDHRGSELRYQHMTYALLSIAAWAMEKTGEPAFAYAGRGRGSLIVGINFHLQQSFQPEQRKIIQRDQIDTYWISNARNLSDLSLSFIEYAVDSGLSSQEIPLLDEALKRRSAGYPAGFFGSHHGGYASCLFAR